MDRLQDLYAAARRIDVTAVEMEASESTTTAKSDTDSAVRSTSIQLQVNGLHAPQRGQQSSPSTKQNPFPDGNKTFLEIMECFRRIANHIATIHSAEDSQRELALTGGWSASREGPSALPASPSAAELEEQIQKAFGAAQAELLRAYQLRPKYWEETEALKDQQARLRKKTGKHPCSGSPTSPSADPGQAAEPLELQLRLREQRTTELEHNFRYFLEQLWTCERQHRDALVHHVARQLRIRLADMDAQQRQQLLQWGNNTETKGPTVKDSSLAERLPSTAKYVDLDASPEVGEGGSRQDQKLYDCVSHGASVTRDVDEPVSHTELTDEALLRVAHTLVEQAQQNSRETADAGSQATFMMPIDTRIFSLSQHELQSAVETRNAILDIESRMRLLHQLFADVSFLVHEQGEQLEVITENATQGRLRTTKAREELKKARHYKRSCGCGCCCVM